MFAQQWPSRKRGRADEDELVTSGFSLHRNKRHMASLPHRTSPHAQRQIAPTFTLNHSNPALSTVTPADSDSEGTPTIAELTNSHYSWSSSPFSAVKQAHDDEPMHSQSETSFSSQMSEGPTYSDDFDMTDGGMHLSPGPFQSDPSMSLANRIPTPINSSFSTYLGSDKLLLHPTLSEPDLSDEAFIDQFRRGRRLPSPISEGEISPSVIAEGISDMQMEVEPPSPSSEFEKYIPVPHKKGHTRSKHSLRNWNGSAGDLLGNLNGVGTKRSFSMGYRADCEKCRNKVPGHFSHIITY